MIARLEGNAIEGRRRAPPARAELHALGFRVVEVLVVEASDLVLFFYTQVQAGDPVDDEQQDTGDDEGPNGAGQSCGELQPHLLPVPVPPAPLVRVAADAVERRHPVGREDARQDVAHHAPHAVDREDVEPLVDRDQVLVVRCEVARRGGQEADQRRDVDGHVARGRRDADQPADDARAEAYDRELPAVHVFQ